MSKTLVLSHLFVPVLGLVANFLSPSPSAFGQAYDLVDPSGQISAMVEIDDRGLLLYERTGEKFYYGRAPRYDSVDNRHLGYYHFRKKRVMRFPRLGFGSIYVADLRDPHPHFLRLPRVAQLVPNRTPSQLQGPYSVFVEMKTIPNAPLPPAVVTLTNDGKRDIQVSVVDAITPTNHRSYRIAPGKSQEVTLVRDSGAKRVSVYEMISAYGDVTRSKIETEIPPVSRYELVVNEWAIQSVAIDRTGSAPVVEDINFQGRGIGRFWLPAGPELQSGPIAAFSTAKAQGNPGLVAPLLGKPDHETDSASILENAVLKAQREALRRQQSARP